MDLFYLISFLQWVDDIVKAMPLYTMVKNYYYVYPYPAAANCL